MTGDIGAPSYTAGAFSEDNPARSSWGHPLPRIDGKLQSNGRKFEGKITETTFTKESDKVEILSGVFEGKTTGTPISLIIYNEDMRSKDYGNIKDKFRPGHADFTYFKKYGIRDYRGGGRSSARETAMRVAAGAIARKIIQKENIQIHGYITQIGNKKIDHSRIDLNEISNNDFFCPDKKAAQEFADYLLEIRKQGDSVGAIIEVIAKNVPVGLGEQLLQL